MSGFYFDDDDDEPSGPDVWHLFTDVEAEAAFKIKANTVRQWHRRGKIEAKGIDEHGRLMFERSDLLALAKVRRRKA